MSNRRSSKGGSTGQRKNKNLNQPPGIQTDINQFAGFNQQSQMPLLPPLPPQYGQAMFPAPNIYSNQQANQPTQYMYVPVPMHPHQQPPQPMPTQYIPPLMSQPIYQQMNQESILQSGNLNWSGHQNISPTEHETQDIRKSYLPPGQGKSAKKKNTKQNKKDKKDKNKGDQGEDHQGSDQINQAKDDRFIKLKSLLADEPVDHFQSETGAQNNPIEEDNGRKGNLGGRRCSEENTQEYDVEDSGSSEDIETDSDGYDFESKSDLHDNQSNSYFRGSQRNITDSISQGFNKKFTKSLEQTEKSDEHENYQTDKSNRVERKDRSQGRRKEKHVKVQSEKDYTEENESKIPDVDETEVFNFFIKNFKGGCTFEDLLKSCHLFSDNSNICLWFKKHSRRFHIFWDGKVIVYIQPFFKDVKICFNWNNRKHLGQCKNKSCYMFHICRRFMGGKCKESSCPLSHSFRSSHNRRLKDKLGISDFSETDIRIILNCNSPSLCADYIYNNGCKIKNSDKRCPYLHLCQNKIFKRCEDPCKFKKTHSITQFHNKWVIESYHMNGWPEERVLGTIYVPPRQREETYVYSDGSDLCQVEDGIDDASTYDNSDVNVSSESLPSTASGPVKKSKKLITSEPQSKKKIRENDKSNISRRERFESTENIVCGIVSKDDLDQSKTSASKIQYDDEDEDEDDNIKERERRMIKMWEQEGQGISYSDNDKGVKQKPLSRNPSDPDYHETNPSLLKDETEKSKICLFVSKDKCPSPSCKNHHLPSGLPYLWQLKISDKWVSFSLAENEIIEQAYCDIQDYVVIEKTGKKFSYHIWFAKMHVVILNVDDQSVSADNQWSNVRRLSTHSFAERKPSVDSYITQWRWYLKDDSDKWTMFDKVRLFHLSFFER
ncbi:Hypothetical predicted protein [Mytilus galloprovincialis]|nr:Hypothetical predicted protein [Mytilus galloprovincialis]